MPAQRSAFSNQKYVSARATARRRGVYGRIWLVLLTGLSLLVGPSRAVPATGPAPLIIRRGGTYTGSYRSTDSQVPCITIATKEPVTLRNCVLSGAGNLIEAKQGWAQLTVVDCRGYSLLPSQDQVQRGYFLVADAAQSVRIENNYFEQTAGISIYQWNGDGSAAQTLTVRYNQAKNIDSRYRNGGGTLTNFLGLNGVRGLRNLEIAWNEVINEPNKSLVEDNIALYNSGGTAQSPFRIHHNYVQGAYPYPATAAKFSGTGMIVDGDQASNQGFIEAYNNHFVSTCNSAMNIASGHDVYYHDNRLVTSGLLPDGSHLPSAYTGIAVFNAYNQASFGNFKVDNNTIGYVQWGRNSPYQDRQDEADYGFKILTNTQHLPNPITLQTEKDEYIRWLGKVRKQGIRLGPAAQPLLSSSSVAEAAR
ncbi:hypothetical protein [Hymenobacter elongatus]|uniref:Right-handed parallel beta-helix repeat-containing protein n=1 Tax=Hymenobacter elongatus TaxID=877208 RepID=A0A4Z0PFV9_9BACT|nr:hypothetical protein [Hymenobacter elongatus]TGE14042.1 hypothetical protein E5J99_17830 [Hymenobacter elongatus]